MSTQSPRREGKSAWALVSQMGETHVGWVPATLWVWVGLPDVPSPTDSA